MTLEIAKITEMLTPPAESPNLAAPEGDVLRLATEIQRVFMGRKIPTLESHPASSGYKLNRIAVVSTESGERVELRVMGNHDAELLEPPKVLSITHITSGGIRASNDYRRGGGEGLYYIHTRVNGAPAWYNTGFIATVADTLARGMIDVKLERQAIGEMLASRDLPYTLTVEKVVFRARI